MSHPVAKQQLRCEATCIIGKGTSNVDVPYTPLCCGACNCLAKHQLREQVASNNNIHDPTPSPALVPSMKYVVKHQAYEQGATLHKLEKTWVCEGRILHKLSLRMQNSSQTWLCEGRTLHKLDFVKAESFTNLSLWRQNPSQTWLVLWRQNSSQTWLCEGRILHKLDFVRAVESFTNLTLWRQNPQKFLQTWICEVGRILHKQDFLDVQARILGRQHGNSGRFLQPWNQEHKAVRKLLWKVFARPAAQAQTNAWLVIKPIPWPWASQVVETKPGKIGGLKKGQAQGQRPAGRLQKGHALMHIYLVSSLSPVAALWANKCAYSFLQQQQ